MATAPIFANDAGAPVGDLEAIPLDDNFMIRTDQIDLGERLRPIDEVWAHALGAMMARDGQRAAIEVCRLPGATRWTIVTGGHRLVGALHAEIDYLRAQVVGANRHERLMSEVLENLARRELDQIDRAAFIAELVTLHKVKAGIDPAKDGRSASAAARWQTKVGEEAKDAKVTMTLAYGWNDAVAEQLGFSAALIKRDLLLFRGLAPSVVEKLREAAHPIAKNGTALRALAKIGADDQHKAVDLILRQQAKTVGDAIAMVKGTKKAISPDNKRLSTIIATLKRMSAAERLGLFQSPSFHDLMPAEARALLAPMRRDGTQVETEECDDESNHEAAHAGGGEARMGGAGRAVLAGGLEPNRQRRPRSGEGEGAPADDRAVAGRSCLSEADRHQLAEPAPVPAVAIRASVKPDYLVCLECGEKHGQLKRHLSKHALDADSYIAKWRLPLDYPFTAPNVSEARRQAAQKLGLRSGAKPGGNA